MIAKLEQYRLTLLEWNKKLNLTRHETVEKFAQRDVFDTVHLATLLNENEEILDVGSGGGVPGVILSIIRPDLEINMSESVGKKAEALSEICKELDLDVTIYNGRAEHILEDFRYDALVARAVGPLWKQCFWFQDHWPSVGRLLAIKGPAWINERNDARARGLMNDVQLRVALKYPMLGTESENVILHLWPKESREI